MKLEACSELTGSSSTFGSVVDGEESEPYFGCLFITTTDRDYDGGTFRYSFTPSFTGMGSLLWKPLRLDLTLHSTSPLAFSFPSLAP